MTVVRLVFQQHVAPAVPLAPATAKGSGDIRIVRNGQTIIIPRLPIFEPGGPMTFSTVPTDFIPQQAVEMAWGFFAMLAVMVVGLTIARAFGRHIDRRGDAGAPNPALSSQLVRIEQAVEAMSIEVERISESQRFMAKLQHGSTAERL